MHRAISNKTVWTLFSWTIKNLDICIVSDYEDISKGLPGPDIGIAIYIHEDIIESNNESEMFKYGRKWTN